MVKLLSERACAKINLFLRVTGRRADGYHELDSIFVPVTIFDRIRLEVRPAPISSITLRCNVASLAGPNTNLAARAARAFLEEFGVSAQVMIDLDKTIPVGAGLGGGSSDAGAVLRMLSSMMRSAIGESTDTIGRLRKIALDLGADVSFFLDPRPSRVTGIGERIEVIENFPSLHLVIAVPPIEVPTATVFKALKRENWSGAPSSEDIDEIVKGNIQARHLVNDLEAPALRLYPEIAKLKALLEESGATATSMSGSGGAFFGLFPDADAAERAAASMGRQTPDAQIFAAKSISAEARDPAQFQRELPDF